MNRCIDRLAQWRASHHKASQWLWFAGLWFAGLFSLLAVSSLIKLMFHYLK